MLKWLSYSTNSKNTADLQHKTQIRRVISFSKLKKGINIVVSDDCLLTVYFSSSGENDLNSA
jgi:hypothetical protein